MSKLFRSIEATEEGAAENEGLASDSASPAVGADSTAGTPMAKSTRRDGKAWVAQASGAGRPHTLADLAEEEARRHQRESLEGGAALKFAIRLLIVIIILAAGTTTVLLLRR